MILMIEKSTGKCWIAHTDNVYDIMYSPEFWDVIEFANKEKMLNYITKNKLELQDETT